jgi:hypothetical protein
MRLPAFLRPPPPTNFVEGTRQLYGALMAAGGVFYGIAGAALTIALIYGPWAPATEALRLKLLGGALAGFFIGSITVTVALAVGGPVGRLKGKVSKDGAELESEGRN